MSLKVYFDLLSQPCRAVVIFLRTNGIRFEEREMDLFAGEHYTEEYKKIHPFGKVPAIVDGDFTLIESVAILRYLCRQNKIPDHWYPSDSRRQARVDEFLEWQHLNTRNNCALYFFNKFLKPTVSGKPADSKAVANYERRMSATLDEMEHVWLRERPYLTGDEISIADLLGACEVEQPRMVGYDPCAGRPKLSAWLERVRRETQPHYDSAHVRLRSVCKAASGSSAKL